MCSISLLSPNPNFNLDYARFNMDYTNDMWETANRVSLLTYAIPLAFVFMAEVIKNGLFLIYNSAVFVINTVSSLIHRISIVFTDCVDGEFNLESINPFSGTQEQQGIASQYSHEDLVLFRLSMRSLAESNNRINEQNPIIAYLVDRQIAIWYDSNSDKIFIQDRHTVGNPTLALKINDLGHLVSLELDGVAQDRFPEAFDFYMATCFQQAMMNSSQYTGGEAGIGVRIVREGLKQIPDYHLDRFAGFVANMHEPQGVRVSFLNFALRQGPEIDAGGPRRDYMDDLWDGLLNGNSHVLEFTRQPQQSEAMPKASGLPNPDGIPRTLEQEIPSYQNMGRVMMYCNHSNDQLSIGRRFEEGMFKAIFTLTPGEVDAENLPFPVQLKMIRAINECRGVPIDNNHPITMLENHLQGNIDWDHARDVAEWTGADGVPENADNEENQQRVINCLKGRLYHDCGAALSPMHQMAKGMKETRINLGHNWGGIAWKAFSDKVQGSLNRQFIVDHLEVAGEANAAIRTKVQWLRNWILNPETPNKKIQDFIKFATGSTTLPTNGRIRITAQYSDYLPVPKAHTCFSSIEISPVPATYGRHNDHTEENFIQSLELMNPDYQMG